MTSRDWPLKPEKPDKVTVKHVDFETGELLDEDEPVHDATIKARARRKRTADAPPNLLQITAQERRDLIAGRISRLIRSEKLEGVDVGFVYIVSWDQLKSFADPETKTRLTPDAHPACWVTVNRIKLAKGKGWTYSLKVEHHDRDRPDPLMKAKAGYTRDRSEALDPDAAPVLSEKDLAKIETDARLAHVARREQDEHQREEALKRQLRALRERLNDTLPKLPAADQQILLAKFYSLLAEVAPDDQAEAA